MKKTKTVVPNKRRVVVLEEAPLSEQELEQVQGGRNGTHQSAQGRDWGWWVVDPAGPKTDLDV